MTQQSTRNHDISIQDLLISSYTNENEAHDRYHLMLLNCHYWTIQRSIPVASEAPLEMFHTIVIIKLWSCVNAGHSQL